VPLPLPFSTPASLPRPPRWSLVVAAAILSTACSDAEPSPHFVSPFDGQTNWPADAPLQVRVGEPVAPEGHDLDPTLISVVNLDKGGSVEGTVVAEKGDLWFYPDAPLRKATRFAWSVAPPYEEARSVHLALPADLIGSGTFHTGSMAEPVGALRLGDDLCIVWSRGPMPEEDAWPLAAGLQVYADGTRVSVDPAVATDLIGIDPLTLGEASLGCLALDDAGIDAATIEGVRIDGVESVWQLTVEDRSLDDLLGERHRLGTSTDAEGT